MPSESVPINNASWSRNSRHWHQFLSLRPPGLNLRLFSLTIKTTYIRLRGGKATHMRYCITVRESTKFHLCSYHNIRDEGEGGPSVPGILLKTR